MHPVDIYAPTPEDTLDLQELELYRLIVEYRAEHGLPAPKLSHALTIVAGRHALDTVHNVGEFVGHDWSDPALTPSAGGQPVFELTGHPGGWEISAAIISILGREDLPWADIVETPQGALVTWQGSPEHDAIMLHPSVASIGVGLHGPVAHVWLSATPDTTGPFGGVPLIEGTVGDDNAVLTAFDDLAMALAGDDTLSGAAGDDILYGNQGADLLDGGAGRDTLHGGQHRDTLSGGAGDDILYGNKADDLLDGGAGNDALFAGKGDDTLLGGAGDDRLHGNKGDDDLAGGPGADFFRFSGGGTDTVRDFDPAGGDRLSLPGPVAAIATAPDGHVVLRHAGGEVHLLGVAPEHWDPAGWLAPA